MVQRGLHGSLRTEPDSTPASTLLSLPQPPHPPATWKAGHGPTHCLWQASQGQPCPHPPHDAPPQAAPSGQTLMQTLPCLSRATAVHHHVLVLCALLALTYPTGPAHPWGLSLPWKPCLSSWLDRLGLLSSIPPGNTGAPQRQCYVYFTPGPRALAQGPHMVSAKYMLAQDCGTGYQTTREAISQHSTNRDQPVIVSGCQWLSTEGWQPSWHAFDQEKLPT